MATQAYRTWVSKGRHYTLAQPIKELVAWAKANGISILGTIGNEEHLQKSMPQDHTPFSFTAWPDPLDGYMVTAIDLANTNGLGQKIEDQARAGKLPWLKYMNHSGQHLDSRDLDGDGKTFEESPSSDEHVHLSIRTDWQHRSIGIFDPFSTGGEDDMDEQDAKFLIWRVEAVAHKLRKIRGGPEEGVDVPLVIAIDALIADVAALKTRPAVPVTDEQLVKLADLLAARVAKPLTAAEVKSLAKEAVKEAINATKLASA